MAWHQIYDITWTSNGLSSVTPLKFLALPWLIAFRGSWLYDHDDVIKLKHFPRYWPFAWGIHRSPVNSPHKNQWHGALMFPLICAWINDWANNRDVDYLRRHRAHYDVNVMYIYLFKKSSMRISISWLCLLLAVYYLRYGIYRSIPLTHWGRDKMAAIFLTTFTNAVSFL